MSGYRPRQRVQKWKPGYRISEQRKAWAQTSLGEIIVYRYDKPPDMVEEPDEDGVQPMDLRESGPTVRLAIHRPGSRRPMTLNLTACTKEELLIVKQLIDLAFEAAIPVAALRDKEAADAAANGDDAYVRLYRPVPTLVIRKGEEPEYDQSVRDGSSSVSEGGGSARDTAGELRRDSDELAQRESSSS